MQTGPFQSWLLWIWLVRLHSIKYNNIVSHIPWLKHYKIFLNIINNKSFTFTWFAMINISCITFNQIFLNIYHYWCFNLWQQFLLFNWKICLNIYHYLCLNFQHTTTIPLVQSENSPQHIIITDDFACEPTPSSSSIYSNITTAFAFEPFPPTTSSSPASHNLSLFSALLWSVKIRVCKVTCKNQCRKGGCSGWP